MADEKDIRRDTARTPGHDEVETSGFFPQANEQSAEYADASTCSDIPSDYSLPTAMEGQDHAAATTDATVVSEIEGAAPARATDAGAAANAKKSTEKRAITTFSALVAVVLIADQFTKALAVYKLGYLHGRARGLLDFLADYFTRFHEFPYRFGVDGYKPPFAVFGEYLRFQLTTNSGAAFSLFRGNPDRLAVVSAVLIVLLYVLYRRWGRANIFLSVAFGLQIGGALGNFVDRVRLGEVVDFVATVVPWWTKQGFALIDFPIFNIADASAVVGTTAIGVYILVQDIRSAREKRHAAKEAGHMPDAESLAGVLPDTARTQEGCVDESQASEPAPCEVGEDTLDSTGFEFGKAIEPPDGGENDRAG